MTVLNGQARELEAWVRASRGIVAGAAGGRRPRRETTAPWLVVTGGKGGVGKTWFAVRLAQAMQRLGLRALIADLDPGLADVDVHLRLDGRYDLEDAIAGRCPPERAVVAAPGGVHVLRGRSGRSSLAAGHDLDAAVAVVRAAAEGFDVVVCDTGAGIGPSVLAPLRAATVAVAVTTPEPAALTDCYALCKVVLGEGLPLPRLLVNRAPTHGCGQRTLATLARACERFLGQRPEALGTVRDDAAVARGLLEQRLDTGGPADADVQRLAPAAAALVGARTRPLAPTAAPR